MEREREREREQERHGRRKGRISSSKKQNIHKDEKEKGNQKLHTDEKEKQHNRKKKLGGEHLKKVFGRKNVLW